MRDCCRDTVTILSAAAAVWGSYATRRILSSLKRVQDPCELCRQVSLDFGQEKNKAIEIIHKASSPIDAMLSLGNAIACILESQ